MKLTPEAEAAVEVAGEAWLRLKTLRPTIEATIRKRVEAEMASEMRTAKLEFAAAAQRALDAGATKIALKRVSSKNPGTLEEHLALLRDDATSTPSVAAAPTKRAPAPSVIQDIHWDGDLLSITLDPQLVDATDYDRGDAAMWTGAFEVARPGNGKTYIDPAVGTPLLHGVVDWLRQAPEHEAAVVAWVEAQAVLSA